jgi:hypothetical protein
LKNHPKLRAERGLGGRPGGLTHDEIAYGENGFSYLLVARRAIEIEPNVYPWWLFVVAGENDLR